MAPQHDGGLVVIGDPPQRVGGVDGGGQGIEQFAEAALALAQRRLRAQRFRNRDHIVGG
jgi:hypothetical protein